MGDFSRIGWLAPLLPADSAAALAENLREEIEDIYRSCPDTEDLHEKKDFLYLDQRIPHVLMPWRDRFTGDVGQLTRVDCFHFSTETFSISSGRFRRRCGEIRLCID